MKNKIKYLDAQFFSDLPSVQKNEILVVPRDNRLWEYGPYTNYNSKPSWWRSLHKDKGSLRRCYGTTDFLSLGLTFPMWTNVEVRPNAAHTDTEIRLDPISDGFALNKNENFTEQGFLYSSTGECPFNASRPIQGHYPKLVTPWQFKTAPGYSTLVLPTLLEPNPNYTVMPGLIHTDYYHTINIVLIVNTTQPFKIEVGTPMYQLITIKRSDNITKIIEGNETMYRFLNARGTGDGYLSNMDRRAIYRRLMKKADVELEEQEAKRTFIDRLLRR